jgi:hypothetical protein
MRQRECDHYSRNRKAADGEHLLGGFSGRTRERVSCNVPSGLTHTKQEACQMKICLENRNKSSPIAPDRREDTGLCQQTRRAG